MPVNTITQPKPEPKVKAALQSPEIRQKYDVYSFQAELNLLIDKVRSDETVKSKVQLLKDLPYTQSTYYAKVQKYTTNKRVQELTKKIDEILEARLIEHGLHKANYGFVIFLLKNHYGYQDKREVETETTHVFKVSRGDVKALKDKKVIDLASKAK